MFIEKRRYPRGSFFCKITAIFGERLLVLNSYTENISEDGVKLFLEVKLHVSTVVDLELFLAENEAPVKCKGELIWVNEIEDLETQGRPLFDTGIQFSEMGQQDQEKVKGLVKKLIIKAQTEQIN